MKQSDVNRDKNKLWQICFPHLYDRVGRESPYIIPAEAELIKQLNANGGGATDLERAFCRLDLTIACLWPYVEILFGGDVFPHRLAAATDLLRAVDLGEGEDTRRSALARELAASLDDLETLLADLADTDGDNLAIGEKARDE